MTAKYRDERVCLSVCLCSSVRDHIFGATRPIFTKCSVHVTYGRGSASSDSIDSDTLRISGFVDDVISAHALIGCSMSPLG